MYCTRSHICLQLERLTPREARITDGDNLVPRACDPWEGNEGSGIIRCRKPGILAKIELRIHFNGQSDSSLKRIIPEPSFPSQGSQARGTRLGWGPFSYPEPILRAVNGARQGALAKSISNWHLIGHNEGCCSNTGYILLPCFYGIRLWIWPEPLVAPRVRRALGTRMGWGRSMYCRFHALSPFALVAIAMLALYDKFDTYWQNGGYKKISDI